MLLTEEEAKTKWCPFVRVIGSAGAARAAVNVVLSGDDLTPDRSKAHCSASDCMAWRWGIHRMILRADRTVTMTLQDGVSEITDPPQPPRKGYCGLAGKPEGE